MKYDGLSVAEFIKATGTVLVTAGVNKGKITPQLNVVKEDYIAYATSRRQEIVDFLQAEIDEQKAIWQARQAKLDAIPGLKEINSLRADWSKWRREFNASFETEDGGGVGVGNPPSVKVEDLFKKYPVAKAYLEAEEEALKENLQLSAIGEKARLAILDNPDKYQDAIARMHKEIDDFVKYHIEIGD